jgi:hypothetical protein
LKSTQNNNTNEPDEKPRGFIQSGAILAYEDLQSSGNMKKEITFDWQDNRGNNEDAHSVMVSQIVREPDFYMSGLKPQTMAISDKISSLEIPHFTWMLDAVINPKSKNSFRVWINFKLEAEAFLKVTERLKIKKIAMLYAQLPAAEYQYRNILIPAFSPFSLQSLEVS